MPLDSSVPHRPGERDEDDAPPQAAAVLTLLDDEYAESILDALRDGPRPAQDLVDACDASRPTVYRRLDTLEAAGVVSSHTALHPDGHHRKEFALAVDALTLELADGSFAVTDTTRDGE